MALHFTTTSDASKFMNVIIYGKSGAGKTTLIKDLKKPIIISSEKGLLSIADYDLPVVEITSLSDLEEAYDYASSNIKKFKTVVLDSLSDIAETVLIDLKKQNKDPRAAYGELGSSMNELIRKFRDLKIDTYFICKSETYETAAGIQAVRPSLPGKKLTNDVSYIFDTVLFLGINEDDEDNTYRYLQSESTSTVTAKDRSNKLSKLERPNLKAIFKKMRG